MFSFSEYDLVAERYEERLRKADREHRVEAIVASIARVKAPRRLAQRVRHVAYLWAVRALQNEVTEQRQLPA